MVQERPRALSRTTAQVKKLLSASITVIDKEALVDAIRVARTRSEVRVHVEIWLVVLAHFWTTDMLLSCANEE